MGGLAASRGGWVDRCHYWLTSRRPEKRRPGPPARHTHEPLILTGHGMHLRVHHGALVVRNGFTHYPQVAEEHRFFRGDRNLPSRIIVVDGSGSISFDVLSWLSEQRVPLVRIDWRGEVTTVLGAGYAADPKRVAAQLDARRDGRALPHAISLIQSKLRNSIETLSVALPDTSKTEYATSQLRYRLSELARRPPKTIGALLGIEGRASVAYFGAWQSLPLRWSGIGRHPIPRDWHAVGQRGTFAREKLGNRNASHPVNAILNYAYAALESQMRIHVAATGFDPRIGVMHTGRRDRSDLVLDLMEPLRPLVDRRVLEFLRAHTFHPADFTIRSDGVCRLNPEMARRATQMVDVGHDLSAVGNPMPSPGVRVHGNTSKNRLGYGP